MKELWQTRNAELDVILEPGDKVIIPFEEAFVYVAGEVNDPKAIPFISSFALLDYVKLAGGFTLNANYKKYYLLDLEGKRIEVPKDYTVSPGDIIYIERNFAQLSNQAFKDVLIYTKSGVQRRSDLHQLCKFTGGNSFEYHVACHQYPELAT